MPAVRRCLLELGAARLASGAAVDAVEEELARLGRALGAPAVQSAATPTGLFVALASGEPAGFRAVGAPLRLDQAAGLAGVIDRVLAAELGPEAAVTELDRVLATPPRIGRLLSAAGLIPVAAGLSMILQPGAANVAVAAVCAIAVTALIDVSARSRLLATLLPVLAAFAVGCAVFGAERLGWVDGPLRTLLAPIAVLLPGALIVTGMSELAAGAMVAGTSRLVFGGVQLLLLTFGVLAAARVLGDNDLTNVRVDELGAWAPWLGILLVGVGVCVNVNAPLTALPWILALLLLTFGAQTGGQEAYGAAFGAFAGGIVAAFGAALAEWRGGPPQLPLFLPSFWLLVPGSLGLIGTTQLATDTGDGFATATDALVVILAIALGVLVGSALGRGLRRT